MRGCGARSGFAASIERQHQHQQHRSQHSYSISVYPTNKRPIYIGKTSYDLRFHCAHAGICGAIICGGLGTGGGGGCAAAAAWCACLDLRSRFSCLTTVRQAGLAGSAGMSAPASGGGEAGGGGARASGMDGCRGRQFSSASYTLDNSQTVANLGCILRLHRALTLLPSILRSRWEDTVIIVGWGLSAYGNCTRRKHRHVLLQLPPLISQLSHLLEQDSNLISERLTEIGEESR